MLKDKKIRLIIKGILVFLIFHYGVYFQLIPIKLFNIDYTNVSKKMLVLLSAFSSICMAFIFYFIYRKDLKKEFKIFKKNLLNNLDIGLKYWTLGLIIMMASNLFLTFVLKSGGANNENAVQEMLKGLPWLMIIIAGFIAPFNEEIVFRKTLKDVFKNKWVFAALSFLLFGGAHVIEDAHNIIDLLYIIPYGALGGAFALAYHDTDTIFTSLSLHMMHNLVLSLMSVFLL